MSQIIIDELADPRLGFITVTRVEPTPDLSLARVFVTVFGSDAKKRTSFRALAQCSGYVQRLVGKRLALRSVPEIRFVEDATVARASRIEDLIRQGRATDSDAVEREREEERLKRAGEETDRPAGEETDRSPDGHV